MLNYKVLYFKLFAQTEDALAAIEQRNYGTAEKILISAQQTAEEAFLEEDEE